jgi:membrane protein
VSVKILDDARKLVATLSDHLRRLVTSPTQELSRAQRGLRYAIDLARHGARELRQDRATQLAAALAYRTLFSLIPIAVLALVVFQSFGGIEQIQPEIQQRAYDFLGLSALAVPEDSAPDSEPLTPDTEPGSQPEGADQQLRTHVDTILSELVGKISSASLQSIGLVGGLIFIWAALSLMMEIEDSFNRIYNCPRGRSLPRRIAQYWTIITLGPVLAVVSLNLAGHVGSWLERGALARRALSLGGLTGIAASWLLFFLLYWLVPNTKVRRRAALAGSLVAAALWELAKWGFKLYVTEAVPYSALYGSLGLIPLFLLWTYLSWLIVLFGLELTYTLQSMADRKYESLEELSRRQGLTDPRWVIPLMTRLATAFSEGRALDGPSLASELRLPIDAVVKLAGGLEEAGFVHQVQTLPREEPEYALARPPDRIHVSKLLEVSRALTGDECDGQTRPGFEVLEDLDRAQQEAAGRITLASLL